MNQYLVRFTHTSFAIVSLILTAWLVASAAQQRERIVLTRSWRLEPVKVVNVKTVTALTVSLVFADPGDPRPSPTWALHFGPSPNSPEYRHRDPHKIIKAGETVELRLSREDYQSLKRRFEQAGYSNGIKRLEIEVREVGFEDGSMVYDGRLYLQDPAYPDDPTKKIDNRYRGKPLLPVLENYVLHCIGALEPERYQLTQRLVQRTFGGGADWNQEIATANGAVLHPAQFAEMVVDQNFAPLLNGSGSAAPAAVEADPKSWKEFFSEAGRKVS